MISGTSATTAQLHGVKPHSECSLVDKSLILRVNSGAQKQLHNRPSLGEGATPRAPRRGAGHRATPRGRFPRPSKGDEKMGAPYVEWAMANRARLLLLPPGGGEAQIGGRRRSKFNLPPGGGMALMKSVAWSHNPRRSPNGETHLAPSRNRHPSPALPGAPDARRSAAQQGQSGPAHYPAPGSSSLLHPAPNPPTHRHTDTPTHRRCTGQDRISRATTTSIFGCWHGAHRPMPSRGFEAARLPPGPGPAKRSTRAWNLPTPILSYGQPPPAPAARLPSIARYRHRDPLTRRNLRSFP